MSCLIATATILLTSSVDIIMEGNSSSMNTVLRSHKLDGAPAEEPRRLGSTCNSNNIVKGRGGGRKLSAWSFGTSSMRLLQQARHTQREGDSSGKQVLLPQGYLICRRKTKKHTASVEHFLLHEKAGTTNMQDVPPSFDSGNAGQHQDRVGMQGWYCYFAAPDQFL